MSRPLAGKAPNPFAAFTAVKGLNADVKQGDMDNSQTLPHYLLPSRPRVEVRVGGRSRDFPTEASEAELVGESQAG